MQLEATRKPIRYRLRSGEEIVLRPGVPTELPDPAAEQLLQKAPDQVRRVILVPTIQPGQRISWEGADLTIRHGVIDFLHPDPDGTIWAFVTLPDGWTAVNMKYVTIE